jgi:hypothetical protein
VLNRFALTIAAIAMLFGGTARAQQLQHTATVSGHPNLNAIRQALNTAFWNLEAHSFWGCGKDFRQLRAIAVIPAGLSMLKGSGKIPLLLDALK